MKDPSMVGSGLSGVTDIWKRWKRYRSSGAASCENQAAKQENAGVISGSQNPPRMKISAVIHVLRHSG